MSKARSERSLRRKANRTEAYVDGMSSGDDEDSPKDFDPEDIIKDKDFPSYFVKEMEGEDLDVEYFQRTGFNFPLFFREKSGLHMKVPGPSFTVSDVKNLIGNKRILEVMNCATQLNAEMTMKDWEDFYMDPDRDGTLLNVISLEFSQTKLEAHVVAPRVVRQIDMIANAWPRHLKDNQEDGTNDMSKMQYPKVQKYCLMSVAGCWTDFHVDFGGTSVWYHLVKGEKHFWLIPPTPVNLKAYEAWTLSGKQSDTFFGDIVEKCGRVVLRSGNTFMIPAGWIHAVYTPEDSLVIGGNFLHPYGIEKFLKIAQIEEVTKVPHKYRFPFYPELLWYVLDKYAYALLGRHHLNLTEDVETKLFGDEQERKAFLENIGHPHLTPFELTGIRAIVLYLHSLPANKKNVPSLLKDPVSLVKDMRTIVEAHRNDKFSRSITGRPLIFWPGIKNDPATCRFRQVKVRLAREPIVRVNAEQGLVLPQDCVCCTCGLDGWYAEVALTDVERRPGSNKLMECTDCSETCHSICYPSVLLGKGVVNIDLPNSWRCPKCVNNEGSQTKEPCVQAPVHNGVSSPRPPTLLLPKLEPSEVSEPSVNVKEEPMEVQDEEMKESETNISESNGLTVTEALSDETVHMELKANAIQEVCNSENLLLLIFRLVGTIDLINCASVCSTWLKISKHKSLSNTGRVDLTGLKMNPHLLATIVKKQPLCLSLDWSNCGKQQLTWLLPKIPETTRLCLVGLEFNMTVSALNTCNCPALQSLNLSYVANLTDASLHKLLGTPRDARPGQTVRKSSLVNLKTLVVKNTEISDVSLRYVSQYLPQLSSLALAGCWKITDAGLAQLAEPTTNTTLEELDISGCKVTDLGLERVAGCSSLVRVDCSGTQITGEATKKFVDNSQHKLKVFGQIIVKIPDETEVEK